MLSDVFKCLRSGKSIQMACSLSELLGLAFVAFILFSMSNRVQFYVKMIFFLFSSLFFAVAPIPLMLRRPLDYRNALIPAWCIVKIGQLIGASFEMKGLENINVKAGAVVVINHQSAIDLIVLGKIWPVIGRATQVAKKELFYILPFGIACWLWGTLFISRNDRSSAQNAINKESKAINEKKSKIILFPEGTRNQSGKILPFKKGSFHIAVQAQCPVQPIVVSRLNFLDSKRKYFGRGRAVISILPEVPTKGLGKDDVEALTLKVHDLMQKHFETLNNEDAAASNMKYF